MDINSLTTNIKSRLVLEVSDEEEDIKVFDLTEEERLVSCPYNDSHEVTSVKLAGHMEACRKLYYKKMETVRDLLIDDKLSLEEKDIWCDERGNLKVFSKCKYNKYHEVPVPELKIHEANCEDIVTFFDDCQINFRRQVRRIDKKGKIGRFYIPKLTRGEVPIELPSMASDILRNIKRGCVSTLFLAYYEQHEDEREDSDDDDYDDEEEEEESLGSFDIDKDNNNGDWFTYNPDETLKNSVMLIPPKGELTKSEKKNYLKDSIEKARFHNFQGTPIKTITNTRTNNVNYNYNEAKSRQIDKPDPLILQEDPINTSEDFSFFGKYNDEDDV